MKTSRSLEDIGVGLRWSLVDFIRDLARRCGALSEKVKFLLGSATGVLVLYVAISLWRFIGAYLGKPMPLVKWIDWWWM